MKGILLSLVSFSLLVLITVFIFRIYRGKKYLRVFLVGYAVSVLLYAVFYAATPIDLGFLPQKLGQDLGPAAFWNGFLILTLLFHCFADVSYTTVLTGFSTQLVVLLSENEQLSGQDIKAIYAATGKEDPVTEWRLNHLIKSRYIAPEGDGYRLLPKGKTIAKVTKFLQKMFNTDMGG